MSNKVPQIRFNGYSEAWEERKLGELGRTFTGLSGKTKEDFGHGDARFVTYMNVFSNPISSLTETDAVEIDDKQHQVQKGDVFFTTSSETPEEVGMSSVWVFDLPNVYLNSFSFGYRPTTQFDLNYLAFMLRSPQVRKSIMLLAQGISRYNISKTKIMDIKVPVPSIEEQEVVGRFFSNIDNLIAANQRKLDLLKEQKKGYLQKMFPKNGAKVPELRFAGFDDDWVQRKVSETAEVNPKTTLPDEFEYVDLGAVVGTSLNETRHEFKVSAPSRAQRLASVGDVFYQTVRPYQKNNYLFENAGITPFVFSTGYAQLRPQGDSYFLLTLLQGENFVSRVMDRSTGTSYPAINSSDLGNIQVDVPTEAEQVKIGSLFKSLDNLIAANQRKLDLLKEQKKGFLQNMFV